MPKNTNEAIFCELLDAKFNEGTPHRYAPGSGSGEQQIKLELTKNSPDFIIVAPPKAIWAIRPRVDPAPIKERHPKRMVGHRFGIAQILNKGTADEATNSVEYFLNRQGELDAGSPPLLRKLSYTATESLYSRHSVPTEIAGYIVNEHLNYELGPLSSSRSEALVDEDECRRLFEFIGSCAAITD